jgi:hypothetical protein
MNKYMNNKFLKSNSDKEVLIYEKENLYATGFCDAAG